VYAPALVAFVGGEDFAIKVGVGGGIGWFALGPREVYVPPYRTSARYIQNVNVTNVTNINVTNINVNNVNYVNRHVGGAVTVVNRETFVSSGNAARGAVKVSTLNMDRARVQPAAVEAFKPRRESILGANVATASIRKPSAQVQQRAVVTRFKPAAPRTRAAVEGVRPAPAQPTLVKPVAQEGRGVKLRPAREGLPQAQVVRPGERPKAVGRQDEGPTTTKPSTARPTPIRPAPRPDQSERPKVSKPTPPPDQPTDRKYDRQPPIRPTPRPQVDDPTKERPTDRSQSNDRPGVSKSPTPERSPRGEPTPKAKESDKTKGKKGKPSPSPSPSPKGNR